MREEIYFITFIEALKLQSFVMKTILESIDHIYTHTHTHTHTFFCNGQSTLLHNFDSVTVDLNLA